MSVDLFALLLLTVWGACVGSFLNVVIYRVPAGLSVVSPPSRCPGCEKKLAAWDNVPILGWLWLRGRCRYCRMSISVQYPLIEALTAALFATVTAVYYFTAQRPPFSAAGLEFSWAVLGVHLALVGMMVAATMIDARLYIIPLGLPWLISLVAMVVLPLSVALGWTTDAGLSQLVTTPQLWADFQEAGYFSLLGPWMTQDVLLPWADFVGTGIGLGGIVGLAAAVLLLRQGYIKQSFAEDVPLPEGADPDDPNLMLMHPHPRREVLRECIFLALPLLGMVGGGWVGGLLAGPDTAFPSPWLSALGGVALGYLGGGAIVWVTRILGTLTFGKEAMGLGDVHLMAAVGAVIGWRDATLAFFIAPFFGLLAAVITAGAAALLKGKVRVIPYGPYLCGATLMVMLLRNDLWGVIFP